MKKLPVAVSVAVTLFLLVVVVQWRQVTGKGVTHSMHSRNEAAPHVKRSRAGLSEDQLLQDVRRLHRAIKLMDGQIVSLSERIKVDEDSTPVPTRAPVKRQAYPTTDEEGDTIFVALTSYRDPDCEDTVGDLFSNAETPANIYLGIVEQHSKEEPSCIPPDYTKCQHNQFCPSDNIRIRRIEPREAKGPSPLRYVAMMMYRGQHYVMIVDSHTRFVEKWDTKVLSMYRGIGDNKAVLSHYPDDWKNDGKDQRRRETTSYLCKAKYDPATGIPGFESALVKVQEKPLPSPFAAAGYLFADSILIHEVPLDPHLPYLVQGLDALYSARMWTHGYNIFSPSHNIVYHIYDTSSRPKVTHDPANVAKSVQRVQFFMQTLDKHGQHLIPDNTTDRDIVVDEDRYGMGTVRSLEDYYRFAGLDPITKEATKDWCAKADL